MASNYSNLKIELMQTGENATTWGDITNTNLGTAIEEAIVGRATANFPTDADFTLLLTDSNSTQAARNFVLNVTSSVNLTTTRNLNVPIPEGNVNTGGIEKPYIIENNTSGGQSIVVKVIDGTGVTVPNGSRAFVYSNGTNVVAAFDYLPSLTAPTLNSTTATATTVVTNTVNPTGGNTNMTLGTSGTGNVVAGTTYNDTYGKVRAIPLSGSAKTTSYTLAVTDVGRYIEIGSGGSITIPNAVFSAGDVVSAFNNTASSITITCSINTAYLAGINTDIASITLSSRGLVTILFISGTVAVLSGNLV